MVDINQRYYDEGWGRLAEAALGLKPENVESQARQVARHAAKEIEQWKFRCTEAENQVASSMLRGIKKRLDEI